MLKRKCRKAAPLLDYGADCGEKIKKVYEAYPDILSLFEK